MFKPLTVDAKCFQQNMVNLPQPIQMHLPSKLNTSSHNFIPFVESTLNLQHFQKNIDPHSLSISEIIDSKKRGYLNAWQVLFQDNLPHLTC